MARYPSHLLDPRRFKLKRTPKKLTRRFPTITAKPMQYPPIVRHKSTDEENDSDSESEGSDVTVSDCDLGEEDMELEEENGSEDERDLQEVSRC